MSFVKVAWCNRCGLVHPHDDEKPCAEQLEYIIEQSKPETREGHLVVHHLDLAD